MSVSRTYSGMREGNESARTVVTTMSQEFVDCIGRQAGGAAGANLTLDLSQLNTDKIYSLNGADRLVVFVSAIAENLADTGVLTFTFWRKDPVSGNMQEIYQAAKYTATTVAVNAGYTKAVAVTDTDGILTQATNYSVSLDAGIAVVANGTAFIEIGKFSGAGDSDFIITDESGNVVSITNGALDVLESANVISSVPAPEDATAASDSVALTKAYIKNTGANTIFIRDNGDPADTDDYPLYPGEEIGPLNGTIRFVCGAGLTSTLSILEVE